MDNKEYRCYRALEVGVAGYNIVNCIAHKACNIKGIVVYSYYIEGVVVGGRRWSGRL